MGGDRELVVGLNSIGARAAIATRTSPAHATNLRMMRKFTMWVARNRGHAIARAGMPEDKPHGLAAPETAVASPELRSKLIQILRNSLRAHAESRG
jgi:hypothetical protein